MQLRLLANLLDGLVAVEGGRGTALGPLYNEVPDRIEDTAILAAFGMAAGWPMLGLWAALAAMACAYVRQLGGALGQPQSFIGPMAKQHRMAAISLGCLLGFGEAVAGAPAGLPGIVLWVVLVGSLVTAARRLGLIAGGSGGEHRGGTPRRGADRGDALLVGGRARWIGSRPDPVQRIYFANHASHMDALVLWAALPAELRRGTRPVAAADYWGRDPLRRRLAEEVLGAVLIERGTGAEALVPLAAALREGASLIVFPEGTRNPEPLPGPFKAGLYFLAREFPGVELVPVYLDNLNRALPKGHAAAGAGQRGGALRRADAGGGGRGQGGLSRPRPCGGQRARPHAASGGRRWLMSSPNAVVVLFLGVFALLAAATLIGRRLAARADAAPTTLRMPSAPR